MTEVIAIFLQAFFQVKSNVEYADVSKYINHQRCALAYCLFSFIVPLLFSVPANCFEKLTFDVEQIESKDWQLKGVSLSLSGLDKQTQQLALSIKQVLLPEPFAIKLFDIKCLAFTWQENKIECQKGEAKLKSEIISSSAFTFSFAITEKQSHFSMQNLKISEGMLSLSAKQQEDNWFVTIKSQGLKLQNFSALLSKTEIPIDSINSGNIYAVIKIKGNNNRLNHLMINTLIKQMSLQANNGKIATESLNIELDMVAKLTDGLWEWENTNLIKQGELYIDPVYMEIMDKGLSIKSKGTWNDLGDIRIKQATVTHPGIIEINAKELLIPTPGVRIDSAQVLINIEDLEHFTAQYLSPFMEQTAFEGLKLKGQLRSEIAVDKSIIRQVLSHFKQLAVLDDNQRISIENAEGEVNWSVNSAFIMPSFIRWEKLKIRAIPIEAGQLKLLLKNKSVLLLEQSNIPLLGGELNVKQFNWYQNTDDEPNVYFEGGIYDVSLEQLTNALDWTPLSGNISGDIPGVDYQNKILTIDGGLKVNLFDGLIKINKLASSGLFTDFSKFYLDMEIDNLDLHALTQKFQMGGMEGRVSGFINNLYLENWEPVTFYAWLGTPDDDDSRHRISQKAVENIASIGGGGAADVISKGFLRFFDTFSYDRIGFGCYLHQGVCQLMGVEAAEQGYYIIKGGGIPRIDIVGYNPQVDWKVLMERLSRISATDDVVIQ